MCSSDLRGNTTTWEYDIRGRAVRMTRPLGQNETYAYDAAGNLISRTDASGGTTTFAYDARGRQVQRVAPDGAVETTTYTPTGQRASVTDARGTTTWAYDLRDRLVLRTDPDGVAIAYEYDANGNIVEIASGDHVVGYIFDAVNRVAAVSAFGGVTTYGYDASGNVTSVNLPNGVVTEYGYDSVGRVLQVTRRAPSGAVIATYTYTLDAAGRRSSVFEGHSGRTITYGYDELSRLVSEDVDDGSTLRQIRYSWDATGNRTRREDSIAGVTNYAYDANDRMLTDGARTFTYDARGNLVLASAGSGAVAYSWDDRNRLLAVDGAAGRVEYGYDVDGHRTFRDNGTDHTRYVVDANGRFAQVLAEADASGATYATYAHAHGVVGLEAPDGVRYALGDGSRSVRHLADESGDVTDAYDYDAFGARTQRTGSSFNPYGYQGEYLDEATGLYYLRARWLDAAEGRFLSVDPAPAVVSEPTTWNRYLYAGGDPVNNIDPSGEFGFASVGFSLGISIVLSNGLGAFGYTRDSTVERERKALNRTSAYGVWGMAAALAIATSTTYGGAMSNDSGASGFGGRADAVRHCTWNGIMAVVIGEVDAEVLATAHEDPFPGSQSGINDREMDLHNNAMGRSISRSGISNPILRFMLSGVGALAAWPTAAASCIAMVESGHLVVLDHSKQPWQLVPSNTPGMP